MPSTDEILPISLLQKRVMRQHLNRSKILPMLLGMLGRFIARTRVDLGPNSTICPAPKPAMMLLAFTTIALLACVVNSHDEHDHDMQMPLDYVKFPYQAVYYPGDNDGLPGLTPSSEYWWCSSAIQ